MRFPIASLPALALAAASFTSSAAQAAVSAPAAGAKLDLIVPPAADSAVAFQTYPNARCVLNAAGTRKTITIYADDLGSVAFHVKPLPGGAQSAALSARCDAGSRVMAKSIVFHVDRRAPRPLTSRSAFAARPLVPFGVNPATLSQADTKRLEIPPRPDARRDPKSYAAWLRAVTTPVRRIRGNTILRRDVVHGPIKGAAPLRTARTATNGKKDDVFTTGIWSGTVDAGGSGQFAYWVAGKWTVPNVYTDFNDSPAYSSIWNGIDGWGSGDVIQNGTEQDAYYFPLFGYISAYSAWYEFYPDGGSTTLPNFSVNPGDEIYTEAWVCYDGNGARYGCFYMQDYTQGEATPVYYELGSRSDLWLGNSAEWIVERPTVNNFVYPLPLFAGVTFSWQHVFDSYNGYGENACDENENFIDMFANGDELANAYASYTCDSSNVLWDNFQ